MQKDRRTRRFNSIDAAVILVVIVAVLGFSLAHAGHAGVDKVIQGDLKIAIDVYVSGLKTQDINLFKVGDKAAITIRNQPVEPAMDIIKVQHWPKQIAFLSSDGKKAVSFPDPANAIAHDFLVTVATQVECTKDGFVYRGNKVKLGNQIELEGFKYRVQGVIADVKPIQSLGSGACIKPSH